MIKRFNEYHLNESEQKSILYINDKAWDLIFNKIKSFNNLNWERPYFSVIGTMVKTDITYINYTDDDDTISYLPIKNSELYPYESKRRQEMKVGKFFKKIFPNHSDREIENMVNHYKALYDINIKNRFKNFRLVKGGEIREWYKAKNSAIKSCMSVENNIMSKLLSFISFRIYKDNPDKINLLILTDDKKKLIGRALVWYLDNPKGEIYMDKIYGDDKTRRLFLEYAKEKGWLNWYNKNLQIMRVYIKKDYGNSHKNPYMDTFHYFNKKEKYLTNNPENKYHGEWRNYTEVPMH